MYFIEIPHYGGKVVVPYHLRNEELYVRVTLYPRSPIEHISFTLKMEDKPNSLGWKKA